MSGFAPQWLTAREPVDARSRAVALLDLLRDRLVPQRQVPATLPVDMALVDSQRDPLVSGNTVTAVDLGSGTGANLRYLAPRLGGIQHWQLVDDDHELLATAAATTRVWAGRLGAGFIETPGGFSVSGASFHCHARLVTANLAHDLAQLDWPESALVTGSALLDLVSEAWLQRVASRCRDSNATVLFALTYDGRMRFKPEDAADAQVRTLVNRHQITDKGFGPALGPTAPDAAATIFTELGYRVVRERSDWRLGPADRELQAMLLDGWFKAAAELDDADHGALSHWHGRRSRASTAAGSEFLVGHEDVLALPVPG